MSVNIHGKEYRTVAERLGEIGDRLRGVSTEVLYLEPQIMVKATITTDRGTFTGISAADPSKSIEAKTPVEVAETSAVGRALAFAGYAGSEIASADEMTKALVSSPKPTTAPKQVSNDTEYDATENALCRVHQNPDGSAVVMKHYQNDKGEWWSHKLENGTWCNGRATVGNKNL